MLAGLKGPLFKSLLIAVFVWVVFAFTSFWDDTLLITSIGASAFIAFTFPEAKSSAPRVLMGGYACACVWGLVFGYSRHWLGAQLGRGVLVPLCLLCVFLTALCMMLLSFEHPPSVALAIGILLSASPLQMAFIALLSISALCLARALLLKMQARINMRRAAAAQEAQEEKECTEG